MTGSQFGELNIGTAAADEFVRLPRLPLLFDKRVTRMATLAKGHRMAGFLRLMEEIFRAQSAACAMGVAVPLPSAEAMKRAADHHMPPLSADDWKPSATYREVLRFITGAIPPGGLPQQTLDVLAALHDGADNHLDTLARLYLSQAVTPPWEGEMLFVAAALQVEFAAMAVQLNASSLHPLEAPGLCPVCGSSPVAGMVVADDAHGRRYLTCGLCSTAWNHVRVSCIVCGGEEGVAYQGIEGDAGIAKAETCDACKNYSKLFYQTKEMAVEPLCDDLATLALDLLCVNAGWKRHAPNPFVLVL